MSGLDELFDLDAPSPPGDLPTAALWYARRGWHVFPIASDTKRPITARGHLDATVDEPTIRAWWESHPTARIGVWLRASGLLAVDVDVADGKPGDRTLAALEAKYGPLPRTNHQRSGRGGQHFVMRDPSPGADGWTRTQADGGACRGNLDHAGCGLGVDVKVNGYIVLSPSSSYSWLALDPSNVEPVPAAWLDVIRKPHEPQVGVAAGIDAWSTSSDPVLSDSDERRLLDKLTGLSRATKNGATFAAIVTIFHDYGLSVDDGWRYLSRWNDEWSGESHDPAALERQVEKIADEQDLAGARGHARRDISAVARIARAPLRVEPVVEFGTPVQLPPIAAASAAPAQPTTTAAAPSVYGGDLRAFLGDDDPGEDPDAWLIEGVVPAGVPAVYGGHPKSCKTFLALDHAICIASGTAWLGRRTKRARALVLAREDSVRETRRRLWRLARGRGLDPRDLGGWLFVDSKTPFYFADRDDVARMRLTIESFRPELIIIDSLSRTHAGDENSKREMSVVTSTWSDLCQLYELTLAPIHHFTKAGEGTLLQRLRGSGDLGALVRHIVGVDKRGDGFTELSFDGNLHPLPEPFLIKMVDAITSAGHKCIRFEDAGSAKSATVERIDTEILAVVGAGGTDGVAAAVIEREVQGNNTVIRKRRDALVALGRLRKSSSRYFPGTPPPPKPAWATDTAAPRPAFASFVNLGVDP